MELIKIENLKKKFCKKLHLSLWYGFVDLFIWKQSSTLRKDEEWALYDVNLSINKGEFVGILGKNGSGKTTLVRTLTGIYQKNDGTIDIKGTIVPFFVGNLALNRFYSGLDNFYFLGATLGFSKKELKSKISIVEEFSELGKDFYCPMGTYSSGMRVRLRFGCIKALYPDILIIDEALSISDFHFQNKCFDFLEEYAKTNAVVLISHDMAVIERYCKRIIVMEKGQVTLDTKDVKYGIDYYHSK